MLETVSKAKIKNLYTNSTVFRTFNYLLCPPSPPPTTSITADEFATFFTDKIKTISSQFSPPLTQDLKPTRSTAQTPIFSFCPLTEVEVSKRLLSSHHTTCPLDPIPSHLLQAISPTLFLSLALNGGGRIFHSPSSPLFSLLALLYCLIYWETLSALLSKLKDYGFDQLVSQRNWHHLLNEKLGFWGTALTERSQLATRWTRGRGGG